MDTMLLSINETVRAPILCRNLKSTRLLQIFTNSVILKEKAMKCLNPCNKNTMHQFSGYSIEKNPYSGILLSSSLLKLASGMIFSNSLHKNVGYIYKTHLGVVHFVGKGNRVPGSRTQQGKDRLSGQPWIQILTRNTPRIQTSLNIIFFVLPTYTASHIYPPTPVFCVLGWRFTIIHEQTQPPHYRKEKD